MAEQQETASQTPMDSFQPPPSSSIAGTLHFISPNLSAFEPSKPLADSTDTISTILWVGGLFDTLGSVRYPFTLARALPPTWSLATASLGSAGVGWGTSSLAQDAGELAAIVAYLRARRPGGKLVLMGHSTGCQDCVEYVVGSGGSAAGGTAATAAAAAAPRPQIEGVILQAPVSDRQALEQEMPAAAKQAADALATEWSREGRGGDALPAGYVGEIFPRVAVTATRWLSLSSPPPDHAGADDLFSSDLPDARLQSTFGKFPASTALLILQGEKDPFIPSSVDRQKLVDRWVEVVKSGGGSIDEVNSGVVPGANHNLNQQSEEIVQNLIKKVLGFIERLDRGEVGAAREG